MTLTWTKENSPRWDAGRQVVTGQRVMDSAG